MKLSIIIPCYDEGAHICGVLDAVARVPLEKEIVVVDDASRDDTRARIEAWPRRAELLTCFKPVNEGKGAAIRSGLALATGDVVVIQDADLEYDPAQLPEVIAPILRGEADVVYGSRFRGRSPACGRRTGWRTSADLDRERPLPGAHHRRGHLLQGLPRRPDPRPAAALPPLRVLPGGDGQVRRRGAHPRGAHPLRGQDRGRQEDPLDRRLAALWTLCATASGSSRRGPTC